MLKFLFWILLLIIPFNSGILAYVYVSAIILYELYFFFLDKFKPSFNTFKKNLLDEDILDLHEIPLYKKYYVFFRYPTASSLNSTTMTQIGVQSIILAIAMIFYKNWYLLGFGVFNFFFTYRLSRKLRPLHFGHFANPNEKLFTEFDTLNRIYEKLFLNKPEN